MIIKTTINNGFKFGEFRSYLGGAFSITLVREKQKYFLEQYCTCFRISFTWFNIFYKYLFFENIILLIIFK